MNEVERLGEELAKQARSLLKDAPSDQKLDVFKAVSSFYLGLQKPGKAPNGKADDPPPNGKRTFSDILDRIKTGEHAQ